MSTPENTATRDPLLHLMGAMSDGSSGYITGMEADGQRQVVHGDVLPTKALAVERPADEWLTERGFKLGEQVEGDPLFRHVTLPDGWTRKGTSHAMHSHILDERGLPVVGIFYKAAFYDRDAHWAPVNPGHQIAGEFVYGEADAVPWDVMTDDECESAVAVLRDYTPDGRLAKYADKPRIDRAVGELERIGVPQVASDR